MRLFCMCQTELDFNLWGMRVKMVLTKYIANILKMTEWLHTTSTDNTVLKCGIYEFNCLAKDALGFGLTDWKLVLTKRLQMLSKRYWYENTPKHCKHKIKNITYDTGIKYISVIFLATVYEAWVDISFARCSFRFEFHYSHSAANPYVHMYIFELIIYLGISQTALYKIPLYVNVPREDPG